MTTRSILRSALLLGSLFPMAVPLACSAPAPVDGERAASGDEALSIATYAPTPSVYAVAPTATDGSVVLSFQRGAGTPLATATLTGPDGFTATANEPVPTVLGPGGAPHLISFFGLAPCTAYRYTIGLGGVAAMTGAIHTNAPGNAACGAGEDLKPTGAETFHGVEHQRFDHSWCTYASWNDRWRGYPQGWDYASVEGASADRVRVGVQHSWDPGSDPFPCAEQFVEVWRARLRFTVQPWQAARATRARFLAGAASYDASGPRAALCTSTLAHVQRLRYTPSYDTTTKSDDGSTWPAVMGTGAFSPWGLAYGSGAEAIGMVDGLAVAEVTNDVTPLAAATGAQDVYVGLADPGDGFGEIDGSNPQFAQDDAVCYSDLTGPVVHLDYAPLPPNTPSHCQATAACATGMTVTCDGVEGNTLQLHRAYSATDDVVVATGVGSVTDGDYLYVQSPSYYVCATNAAGTACAEAIAKPAAPSCGGGDARGGSGSGGSGGGSTKCNGLKFCRQ